MEVRFDTYLVARVFIEPVKTSMTARKIWYLVQAITSVVGRRSWGSPNTAAVC